MPIRSAFLVAALGLGVLACSRPEPEPQPTLERTRDADRLSFDFHTFKAPTSPIEPGVHGTARIHLDVLSDGSVGSAERIDGSDAVWRHIRIAVPTIRSRLRMRPTGAPGM